MVGKNQVNNLPQMTVHFRKKAKMPSCPHCAPLRLDKNYYCINCDTTHKYLKEKRKIPAWDTHIV